jgi:hypothetical protein
MAQAPTFLVVAAFPLAKSNCTSRHRTSSPCLKKPEFPWLWTLSHSKPRRTTLLLGFLAVVSVLAYHAWCDNIRTSYEHLRLGGVLATTFLVWIPFVIVLVPGVVITLWIDDKIDASLRMAEHAAAGSIDNGFHLSLCWSRVLSSHFGSTTRLMHPYEWRNTLLPGQSRRLKKKSRRPSRSWKAFHGVGGGLRTGSRKEQGSSNERYCGRSNATFCIRLRRGFGHASRCCTRSSVCLSCCSIVQSRSSASDHLCSCLPGLHCTRVLKSSSTFHN